MKIIFTVLGAISLALGVLGAFLPILPTTPFILLAGFLFARSSPKLDAWIMNHKIFGKIIHDYRVEKAITLHAKIIALVMLWSTILASVFIALHGKLGLQIMLISIAAGVSIHILRFKTKKKDNKI